MSTTISASLVKELRDAHRRGVMECKRALQETDGDLEAARTLLRERGMALAGKRAGRATSEGLVGYHQSEGRITMVAVGCETEPVSKNDEFQASRSRCSTSSTPTAPRRSLQLEQERVELVAKLGENILVTGAERYEAVGAGETLGAYVHPPANKLGVVVKLAGGTPGLARRSRCTSRSGAPNGSRRGRADGRRRGREADPADSDELEGKPEQAKEKIVEGMLAKRFFAARLAGRSPSSRGSTTLRRPSGRPSASPRRVCVAFELLAVAE